MSQYKKCTLCLQVKPLSSYHKDADSFDKLTQRCASCRRILQNAYRLDKKAGTWESKKKPLMTIEQKRLRNNAWSNRRNALRVFANATVRAKRFQVFMGVFTKREIKRLYSSPCIYCGSWTNITLDHVMPLARGGRHCKANIVAACLSCNSSKKNKTIQEWKKSDRRVKFLL